MSEAGKVVTEELCRPVLRVHRVQRHGPEA